LHSKVADSGSLVDVVNVLSWDCSVLSANVNVNVNREIFNVAKIENAVRVSIE